MAFLDTGTTYVYVSKPFYSNIVLTFNEFCSKDKLNCAGNRGFQECYHAYPFKYKTDDDFMDTFPTFEFEFEGHGIVKWFPQDYFVGGPENAGYKCIGIKVLKDMILGALFMRNYDISFEKSGKKITFVRSNCGKKKGYIPSYGLIEENVAIQVSATKKNEEKVTSKQKNIQNEAIQIETKNTIIPQISENPKSENPKSEKQAEPDVIKSIPDLKMSSEVKNEHITQTVPDLIKKKPQ